MQWYLKVLRQYVDFAGRARRTEYWMFTLFNVIISLVLAAIDYAAGLQVNGTGVLGGIYALATFLPGLAVAIRRLHDIDRGGWWTLLVLLPIIGWIVLIVFYVKEGQQGSNRFGPDPKAVEGAGGQTVAYGT